MMAVNYGSVYVARVAMGGNDQHTVKAFIEAESWDGPSLIIAYSHCIAHGYDLLYGLEQQKNAVLSAYWPLFRYDPRRVAEGKNPFQLDSRPATLALDQYIYKETRYSMLVHSNPEIAKQLLKEAELDVRVRWKTYEQLAAAVPTGAVAAAALGAVKAAADAKVEAAKEAK
jgi:pyruvate-ferredoxin/flavodoxin oxidoreductase